MTPAQERVLRAVESFTDDHGYPPTIRELCRTLGVASPSTVHTHVLRLIEQGRLEGNPRSPRTLRVTL